MLQALQKIELMSLSLSFEAMIAVGALLLATGLCVWLGGLRWMFLSAVLSGAFTGLVCASFVPDQFQVKAFSIAAVAVTCFVAILRKRSLVFIAALIVVFAGLFISALPAMNASSDFQPPQLPERAEGVEKLLPGDSLVVLSDQLFFLSGMVGTHIKGLSTGTIVVSLLAGSSLLVVGIFFSRIISAVGSSMLGTFFIFSGMIVLLLQKGSMPFTGVYNKPIFYQTIIICMIIFGSVCGLLLCPIRRVKPERDKNEDGDK